MLISSGPRCAGRPCSRSAARRPSRHLPRSRRDRARSRTSLARGGRRGETPRARARPSRSADAGAAPDAETPGCRRNARSDPRRRACGIVQSARIASRKLDRARALVVERRADRVELGLQITGADAEDEPPFRHHVDARQLLREHGRVPLRQDDDAGAEPDGVGDGGDPRERDRGIEERDLRRRRRRRRPAGRGARRARPSRATRDPAASAACATRAATSGSAHGPRLMPK